MSGAHNFPVCDFRCLRKAYPTQMVHVFNPQPFSIHLEQGERFSKILERHPQLECPSEDTTTRLDPREGFVRVLALRVVLFKRF